MGYSRQILVLVIAALFHCRAEPNAPGKPKITPVVFPEGLSSGQRASTTCTVVSGEPPFSFEWYKDGQIIESFKSKSVVAQKGVSLLTIDPLALEDAGNYTCTVTNSFGTDSASARLTVNGPPLWKNEPQDVSTEKGQDVVFHCEAEGFPKPTSVWKKKVADNENEDTLSHGRRISIDKQGTLTISGVQKEDEGTYICEASNNVGTPLRKSVKLDIHVPARFEEKFSSMTVKRGDSAKLQCNALGDQPLIINWKKDTTEMRNRGDARHEILETMSNKGVLSELIIRETERSDSALYKCTCENGYGKDERTIKLTILEVPSQPLNIRIEATWSRSVSVAWAHPYNGNSPITKYVIQYWKNEGAPHRLNEHEVSGSQTTALIKELRPGKPYALAVVAENDVGRGDPSVTVPFHTGEEEPSAAPVDVLTETKGSTSVLVSWKAPPKEEWNGELRGYYVGYKAVSSDQPYSFKTVDFSASLMQDHLLTNLRKDTEYNIVVKAFNSAGSGPESQELRVHTLSGDLPSPPSLRLVSATEQSIEVGWRPGPQGVPLSGFTLHYRREGGPWKATPLLSAHESSFKLKDLQEGTLYYLYLTASNSYGAGDPSEVLKVKTSAVDMQIIPDSEVRTSEMPFYFDLTLIVPALASFATVVVVCVVACLWVKRVQAKRTIVEQAYQQQNQFIYTGPSQRYVDIEKPRPPSIQSDHGSTTDLYPSPYATIPVQDNTLTRNKKELHQEMKIYFQSGCAPKPNMKDRPLPKPSEEPNTVRSDHVYDSAQ